MKIQLTYGRSGLAVTLPDDTHIFSPIFKSGLPNEAVALQRGLRNPIGTSPLGKGKGWSQSGDCPY